MKICYDNLENIVFTKNGNFWDTVKKRTYYAKDCEACEEEFLASHKTNKFCCLSCANKNKHHTEETKKRMSNACKGRKHHFYGKHHTEETKKRMSNAQRGEKHPMYCKHHTEESKKRMSDANKGERSSMYGRTKEKHPKWKGGYHSKGIPTYDTYAHQLDWCEDGEVRRNPDDPNVLEVKCVKCGKWYVPSRSSVKNRAQVLKGNKKFKGEHRFYCSEECKHACSIFHKSVNTIMKEDAMRAGRMEWLEMDREVQPELRKMVLARDNHTCRKCGSTNRDILQCHHVKPVATDPLESADVDNCRTYCVKCHKEAHQKDGCRYGQLRQELCF